MYIKNLLLMLAPEELSVREQEIVSLISTSLIESNEAIMIFSSSNEEMIRTKLEAIFLDYLHNNLIKGMIRMKQAVHFGAGNIGRGFIGALFSQSGYHVTFIDIADQIINQLNEEKQYQVRLATDQQETVTIENVSGLNNLTQEKEVIEAIKHATYLTTAIGPEYITAHRSVNSQGINE